MQAMLNQVIELCLIAPVVLFALDIVVKVADGRRDAAPRSGAEPVVEVEAEAWEAEALPSVDLPGYVEFFGGESSEVFAERLQEWGGQAIALVDVWADEDVVSELEIGGPEIVALDSRSIRELKKLASECGIPRYSRLNKAELIAALAFA